MNPELKKKISDEFEKMFPKDAGWITCAIKGCGIDECGWVSVRDFLLSSIDTAYKTGLEKSLEMMPKRIRCAACDGSKCEHTLACKSLAEMSEAIKKELLK